MRTKLRLLLGQSRLSILAISAMLVLVLAPVAAHADNYNYGSGVYGGDLYNGSQTSSGGSNGSGASSGAGTTSPASSSPGEESTVVQTPSGLEVAINLTNGQAIPSTGYYITITPINSEGKTFDKAEIYLDGKLMFTGAPDGTGTLKWLWETNKYPASKVKIIIFGPGDSQSVHEFDVTVAPVQSGVSTGNNSAEALPQTNTSWPIWVIAALAIVFVLLVIVIWLLVKRRRGKQLPPSMFPPTPSV